MLRRLPNILRTRTMSTQSSVPISPRKEVEDVWKYPRPPALQRTPKYAHPSLTPHYSSCEALARAGELRYQSTESGLDRSQWPRDCHCRYRERIPGTRNYVRAFPHPPYTIQAEVGRHPPTYYLPPDSIKVPLQTTSKRTFCEVCPHLFLLL